MQVLTNALKAQTVNPLSATPGATYSGAAYPGAAYPGAAYPGAASRVAGVLGGVGAMTSLLSAVLSPAVGPLLTSTAQPVLSSVQKHLRGWRQWTWNEVYLSLMRERDVREQFEIDEQLISDPEDQGAELGDGETEWHFRFPSDDGFALCIQHRGDRYLAWLEQYDVTRRPVSLDELALPSNTSARRQALAALVMVFVGSLWVVVEKTLLA